MDHNIVLCAGRDAPQAADRQELLTELLQGCGEFPLSRAQHGLNLGGMGYYLFLGELADPAPGGCRSGKRLPPPSEELLHGCAGIVGRYSGGEVFFLPPDQLCIIMARDILSKMPWAAIPIFAPFSSSAGVPITCSFPL